MDARFLHLSTASFLTIVVGIFPYLYRRSDITRWFAGAHVLLGVWCLNEIVAFLPISHHSRLVIFRLSYIAGVYMVWNFVRFLLAIARVPLGEFPRSWRALSIMGWISIALTFTPWLTADIRDYSTPFQEVPGPAYPVFVAFMLCGLGLALYQLGRGYKRATGHTRTQLRYLFFASFFEFLEGLLFFTSLYFPGIGYWYFYLQVFYATMLAYTIVGHQLMDITVIIRKTLEYSVITGILMLVYVGVVALYTYVLERVLHMGSGMGAIPAAIAVTLLFHPLRVKIQGFVDRKFFRESVNSEEALGGLADQIVSMSHAQDIAMALLDVLRTSLHPKIMALYLRHPQLGDFQLFSLEASGPWPKAMPRENPWATSALTDKRAAEVPGKERLGARVECVLPLEGQNNLAGYLVLGEKRSEVPLSEDEIRFVETALRHSSLAYEQALLASRWTAGQANELLADVARGFVHEIKTPLSNINLPAQATFMDLEALEGQKRSLETLLPKFNERMKFIMTQAIKASQRIEAIKDFAALGDPRLEPVDLSLVLNDCASTLRPMIEEAQVRFHIEAPEGMALVQANPKHLEIVFGNLLKNAVESIQTARRPAAERLVTATIWREGDIQEVSIRDSGMGIKAEDLPHLFERSFTTKGIGGTGVGLFLTRQLVEGLGGKIFVSSQENQGATFTVHLPLFSPQRPSAFRPS